MSTTIFPSAFTSAHLLKSNYRLLNLGIGKTRTFDQMSCYWECQRWSGTRAQGCNVLLSRGNIKADESCYAFVFARRGVNKMSHRKSTVWMVNRQVLALSKFLTGATKCFSEVWPVRVRGNSRHFMLINTEQRLHYLGIAWRDTKVCGF